MALKIFKSARAALEGTTRGVDLPPVIALEFDEAFHQQDVQSIRPVTLNGSYSAYRSASAGTETNTLELAGALGYDMAIWLANTHIKYVASGVKGVGVDYLWTFLPTHTSDDIRSATVQIGYSDGLSATQPAMKLNYCLGDELSIKWDKAGTGEVRYTSKMVSPVASTAITAFTGAAAVIGSSYVASAATTAVTVDTTTIGSTADTMWTDLTWTLTNGYQNLYTLSNSTAAVATFRPGPRTWKLEGTRYYGPTGSASTEMTAYKAKTPRKFRIRSVGPVVGSSTYWVTLDCYGVYTALEWVETDGMGMQKFTLEPIYDSGATSDFVFTVTSALTTIA